MHLSFAFRMLCRRRYFLSFRCLICAAIRIAVFRKPGLSADDRRIAVL